ncbi:MAG TPA: DUF1761 domain-containing protein [Gammaproteobacteria bacterium]|nr:DUF1761 domain-containing protein [Gammaproteobacteria bacterium]
MDLANFSYVHALVAGVFGFVLGAIWYAPFTFGPLWLRYNGAALDTLASGGRLQRYLIALISSLVQAFVLAIVLAAATSEPELGIALVLGFLLWLGFTAAPSLADSLLSRRPMAGWAVDIGHRLLVTLGIAFVLGVW